MITLPPRSIIIKNFGTDDKGKRHVIVNHWDGFRQCKFDFTKDYQECRWLIWCKLLGKSVTVDFDLVPIIPDDDLLHLYFHPVPHSRDKADSGFRAVYAAKTGCSFGFDEGKVTLGDRDAMIFGERL